VRLFGWTRVSDCARDESQDLHPYTPYDQKNRKETETAGLRDESDEGYLRGLTFGDNKRFMAATYGFTSASDAASRRSHSAAGCLEQECNDVAPYKQPHNDPRFDEKASFLSEMCGESRQDDVVVGDERTRGEKNRQRFRNVNGCAPRLVMPSDSATPAENHGKGSDNEREHITLSTVAEPIYVFQGETGDHHGASESRKGGPSTRILTEDEDEHWDRIQDQTYRCEC
jgi:hypothetical protein